jgi:hypothetical protein
MRTLEAMKVIHAFFWYSWYHTIINYKHLEYCCSSRDFCMRDTLA